MCLFDRRLASSDVVSSDDEDEFDADAAAIEAAAADAETTMQCSQLHGAGEQDDEIVRQQLRQMLQQHKAGEHAAPAPLASTDGPLRRLVIFRRRRDPNSSQTISTVRQQ